MDDLDLPAKVLNITQYHVSTTAPLLKQVSVFVVVFRTRPYRTA
jgi:hypothetical protein